MGITPHQTPHVSPKRSRQPSPTAARYKRDRNERRDRRDEYRHAGPEEQTDVDRRFHDLQVRLVAVETSMRNIAQEHVQMKTEIDDSNKKDFYHWRRTWSMHLHGSRFLSFRTFRQMPLSKIGQTNHLTLTFVDSLILGIGLPYWAGDVLPRTWFGQSATRVRRYICVSLPTR